MYIDCPLRVPSLFAGVGPLTVTVLIRLECRQRTGGLQHPWFEKHSPFLDSFTELTGISVKQEIQSDTEYVTEVPVKLGGGSATPDVYMVWALGQSVAAGWLEPLDGYYNVQWAFFKTYLQSVKPVNESIHPVSRPKTYLGLTRSGPAGRVKAASGCTGTEIPITSPHRD